MRLLIVKPLIDIGLVIAICLTFVFRVDTQSVPNQPNTGTPENAVFLPAVMSSVWPSPTPGATDWPMVGANPQRTSHNEVEVRGNLSVDWYRVIDPYVDSKVQVIASAGKIFLSTAKGLYAVDATSGAQLWVYGTELPLGNSPTIATIKGKTIAFTPGYDHRIQAIDITTGTPVSGYTPFEAEAGFEANPLVINDSFVSNIIFAPNRDGNLYALDAITGAKKWQFSTNGPIRFSAAYKNNIVYIVSDDSYAYAVNGSTGAKVWQSAKLPGYGFSTYWPVVWTDTYSGSSTAGQDFILITASKKAAAYNWVESGSKTQYHQENYEISNCTGASFQSYLWSGKSTVLDCTSLYNYFNKSTATGGRPDRRNLFILNASNGVEKTPYAPINWAGASHGGNKYPPIVGSDNVIYTHIGQDSFATSNGGCSGWISGWKFGTKYISKIWDDDGACDEPPAFTSGGTLIYWGEAVNHQAWGTIDIAKSVGTNYYTWQDPRQLTGARSKYYFNPNADNLWLGAIFGSPKNGVYSFYDGVTNQSPIPYNGKLYLVVANVLVSLSPSGTATQGTTIAAPSSVNSANISMSVSEVAQRLEAEVQKIIGPCIPAQNWDACHLRPGYYNFGHVNRYLGSNFASQKGIPQNEIIPGDALVDYFHTPGDTLQTLSMAIPFLAGNPALQTHLKNYLKNEQAHFPIQTIANIGYSGRDVNGTLRPAAKREAYDDTPELSALMNTSIDNTNSTIASVPRTSIHYFDSCCSTSINIGTFPADAFYGAWQYAKNVLTQAEAKTLFDAMKPKLQTIANTDMSNATYRSLWPYIVNQYIAGYRGYLELEKLAGYTTEITQSTRYQEYQTLLNERVNTFSKDSPFSTYSVEEYNHNFVLNVARNFMWMTPELGDALNINKRTAVQQALDEYSIIEPFWFVPKYERTYEEGVGHHLYDRWALFQAKAYALKQPFSELVKYLDEPAFEKGDLFYIQNLVAALDRAASEGIPPAPTLRPTATPTPISHPPL